QPLRPLDHARVVEVQAGNRQVGAWVLGLLHQRQGPPVRSHLDDAVGAGVADPVAEHGRAVDLAVAPQLGAHPGAVEQVVPQHQGARSPSRNLSASTNAWARPSGEGWIVYCRCTPNRDPSPRTRWNAARSSGVVITRMSRIPASIRVLSG